ncbi:MAG: hypothetical protein JXR83_12685 [Deltaproteobacteria bacterium]|nr:hypothetical protein [Deltaproteobacteria bacterium]
MRWRLLQLLLGGSLLAACDAGNYRTVLVYPSDSLFERARTVELFVGEDMGCAELRQQSTLPRLIFDAHGTAPALGRIEFGRVATLARVRDDDCAIFLDGCAEAVVEAHGDVTLRIPLEAANGGSCRPGEVCLQARCVAADAGAADAIASDARDAATDSALPDSARPDSARPDSARPDSARPDSTLPDSTLPDSAQPDSAQPDSAQPDSALPDSALPDSARPDSAQPDSALPPDLTTGLVGHWTFDETSGSVAHDVSGHGHDGTISGATRVTRDSGGALSFDGDDDHVSVPYAADLDLRGPLTLALWFKTETEPGGWDTMIDHSYPTSYFFGAGDGTRDLEFWLADTLVVDSGNDVIQFGNWMHAAVTYTASGTATIYVDGAPIASASCPLTVVGNSFDVHFGSRGLAGFAFAGQLDGIYFYSRALSAGDVAALYAAGD